MAPEEFKRKLTPILSSDVEGYSCLMCEEEEAAVKTLEASKGVSVSFIKKLRRMVLKTMQKKSNLQR